MAKQNQFKNDKGVMLHWKEFPNTLSLQCFFFVSLFSIEKKLRKGMFGIFASLL